MFVMMWALAALAGDTRADCSAGSVSACHDLAIELASRLAASSDPSPHRVSELFTILAADPGAWPHVVAAPSTEPRCPHPLYCADWAERPAAWPARWRPEQVIDTADGTLAVMVASQRGVGLNVMASPAALVDAQGAWVPLPGAFCQVGFGQTDPPQVVGLAGPDCDRWVRLDLGGRIVGEEPLPLPDQAFRDSVPPVASAFPPLRPPSSTQARLRLRAASPRQVQLTRESPAVVGGTFEVWRTAIAEVSVGPDAWSDTLLEAGSILVDGRGFDLPPGETALEIAIAPEAARLVQVVDADGAPVAGALVRTDLGERHTDARGFTEIACRFGVQATSETSLGSSRCPSDRIVLQAPKPRCRVGSDEVPCDELGVLDPRVPAYRVVTDGPPVGLEPLIEVALDVRPAMLAQASIRGRDEKLERFAAVGDRIDVRAGPFCGEAVVTAEQPTRVDLAWCDPLPVRRRLTDAAGEPILLGDAAPDGGIWIADDAIAETFPWAEVRGDTIVLPVPASRKGPRRRRPDASVRLIGTWYRDQSPVRIWADGRVESGSGSGLIAISLPGVALVRMHGTGLLVSDGAFVLVPMDDDRVLVGSPEQPPSYLHPSPTRPQE